MTSDRDAEKKSETVRVATRHLDAAQKELDEDYAVGHVTAFNEEMCRKDERICLPGAPRERSLLYIGGHGEDLDTVEKTRAYLERRERQIPQRLKRLRLQAVTVAGRFLKVARAVNAEWGGDDDVRYWIFGLRPTSKPPPATYVPPALRRESSSTLLARWRALSGECDSLRKELKQTHARLQKLRRLCR